MNDAVIGLDAVTMVVSGKCPKQIEQRVEKRNKQGQLYLRVDKTKQRDTYNVTIVLLMQLSTDDVKNKVIVSDMMKRQDRATSIAIMKLSQMPMYDGLITPRMKENLLVQSKSDAEIKWQEKQDNKVVEVGKELADVTMKSFMLDKTEAVIFPKENVVFK